MWILLVSVHTERQCKANSTFISDVAFMGGLLVETLTVCNGAIAVVFSEQHLKVHLYRTLHRSPKSF